MPKGKNHYVPQRYLRHFSSKPRKIHVHHIRSGRSIFDVGLKDQCQYSYTEANGEMKFVYSNDVLGYEQKR